MEMLVAIAAGGFILTIVSVLFIESARTWRREEKAFAARQSGDRFLRDFRRDLRRSLPGGAGYEDDSFIIEFSGGFLENEEDSTAPAGYTARYYMAGDRDNTGAVREIFINEVPAGERKYPGVVHFSLAESEQYTAVFNLEVRIAGVESVIRASIHAPAEGAGL